MPAKMYDVEGELSAGAAEEGAAAASVAIVIDSNAQDSGSGYYAVTDDGPPIPNLVPPQADLPGLI